MNVVYMSPHFPYNFWNFCRALKEEGITSLGIGDQPYHELQENLKNSLDEYVYVSSLENYDEVYRAFAYLISKYGRIDYVESNNEYWLTQDAKLRTDFNIANGVKTDEIRFIRYKSEMKALYEKAGVPTARYHLVTNLEESKKFIRKVGYPVIVKPNDGVGASFTRKISNLEELVEFHNMNVPTQMIMEEFVKGELVSFDGLCNSNREPVYMTSHHFPQQIMDIVNDHTDLFYYSIKDIPEKLKEVGCRVLKAFPSQKRFFHCEYFVMTEDKRGLGKKGDIIGLEVNMRTPGGPTPDMQDYAADIDIYRIWARILKSDESGYEDTTPKYYTVYCGRRDGYNYENTIEDIVKEYGDAIVMNQSVPAVIAGAMGDYMLVGRFKTREEILPFARKVLGDKFDENCLL